MLRKLTNLLVRAFLCPVCPPLCCFALAYIVRDVFSGDYWNTGMELAVKEQWQFGVCLWGFLSLSQHQRYKGCISRTSRLHSVTRLHWEGLSAPFSNHSCFVVLVQRAPGSHSTGLLSISSSLPALELLLPAPVYSALLSKPHLYKPDAATDYRKRKKKKNTSQEKACLSFCDVSGPFRVKEYSLLKNQQTRLAVWNAVGSIAHKMSLFQCSNSYLIQLLFGVV